MGPNKRLLPLSHRSSSISSPPPSPALGCGTTPSASSTYSIQEHRTACFIVLDSTLTVSDSFYHLNRCYTRSRVFECYNVTNLVWKIENLKLFVKHMIAVIKAPQGACWSCAWVLRRHATFGPCAMGCNEKGGGRLGGALVWVREKVKRATPTLTDPTAQSLMRLKEMHGATGCVCSLMWPQSSVGSYDCMQWTHQHLPENTHTDLCEF